MVDNTEVISNGVLADHLQYRLVSFNGLRTLQPSYQPFGSEPNGASDPVHPHPNMSQRFSKRVIALWLAGKLLKTKDGVRLPLDGLGTVGSVLG
jgi:hypothetical protein